MQCTNCRFENMPGSARCARCDSIIEFQHVAVDVHPPRAKKWHRHFRGFFNATYGLRRRTEEARIRQRRFLEKRSIPADWTPQFLSRCMIPGLPQFALGRRRRGHIFLWGWLATCILAILAAGSPISQAAMVAMFTLHVGSVYDGFTTTRRPFRTGMLMVAFIFAALFLLGYFPAVRLLQVAVRVYVVQVEFAPYHAGDSLILYRLGTRQPGDIVMYNRGDGYNTTVHGHGHQYYVVRGPGVDRILAKEGDHVVSSDAGLMVNGSPCAFQPLNGATLPHFDMRVPAGHFLIWPSVVVGAPAQGAAEAVIMVPADAIVGRVFFQTAPFAKWGPVR